MVKKIIILFCIILLNISYVYADQELDANSDSLIDWALLPTIDEDTMATNSATKLPSQQSVKAYVDTAISGLSSTYLGIGATAANSSQLEGHAANYFQTADADLTTWAGITPGANVGTALAIAVGSAGAIVVNGGVLGTPSSGNLANCTFPTLNQNTTGTAAGLTAQYIDWNSGSGGSSIANKPTIPTASSLSVDDLITLSGVVEGSVHLGTFTGTTISDSQTIKAALQEIETFVEGLGGGHAAVTLAASATTGGLSLSTQEIGFQASSTSTNGYLTSTDWNTFNSKQAALTNPLVAAGTQALTANWDVGSYSITALSFTSDVTTGTAPFTVASTTVVSNLNASFLEGHAASYFQTALTNPLVAAGTQALTANWDAGSYSITALSFTSDVATGTAPFTVASTTVVSNLNADSLDGGDWAAPAAIGTGTPAAGTFTTLSAGSAGFTVDADGDVIGKTFTTTKVNGVAGLSSVAEADTTSTLYRAWMGPADVAASWSAQWSSSDPAGSFPLFAAPAGTGDPNGNAVSAMSWVTPGTGVATALAVNIGSAGAIVVNGGALGTPSGGTLTNATGLPISTGVSGLGANVATFLATPSVANLGQALSDEGAFATTLLGYASAAEVASGIGVGTEDSPQLTGIELGHASDTTFTRLAAGRPAVEGKAIVLSSSVANKSAGYTIGTDDPNECYGGTIYMAGAGTVVGCAAAVGVEFTVVTYGAYAVSVDPDATGTEDTYILDGTALAQGAAITNTSTTGDTLYCKYQSADTMFCWSGSPDGDHWTGP